jgi:hypothetical protein
VVQALTGQPSGDMFGASKVDVLNNCSSLHAPATVTLHLVKFGSLSVMVTNSTKAIPAKSEERIVISRAEVCLLLLLVVAGLGTWVWVDRKMNVLLKDREPREALIKAKFHVASQQADLLMAEKERKAIEAQLINARLDQSKQNATTIALAAAYPELTKPAAADTKPTSIDAETVKTYKEAHIRELMADHLVQSLSERLEVLKTQATQTSAALEQSQHLASTEFLQSHAAYMLLKRVLTFAASLMIVLVMILIVRSFVSPRAGRRFVVRSPLTFLVAVAALFVLFAYQSFELAGAALVGVVVLLIIFSYIPWPAKTQPVAPQPNNDPAKQP